ncbi:MAG: hypothetical protein KC978_23580, partial [Candidatus Omnitrophica bacterium]|nr:hypothetical protein [Candidatus Omnitrophota bacterium]
MKSNRASTRVLGLVLLLIVGFLFLWGMRVASELLLESVRNAKKKQVPSRVISASSPSIQSATGEYLPETQLREDGTLTQ